MYEYNILYNINYNILFIHLSIYNEYQEADIMENKLQIQKKPNCKGDDGYKTFSVRIKEETVKN